MACIARNPQVRRLNHVGLCNYSHINQQVCFRRTFHAAHSLRRQRSGQNESSWSKARKALADTQIQWYAVPAAVGIGFLGAFQLYKVARREKAEREEEAKHGSVYRDGDGDGQTPRKRKRIRPSGPWYANCLDG